MPKEIEKKDHKPGFIDFIREQGVVGLAVGFLLGRAVSDLVGSIVDNLINPIVGIALGSADTLLDASISIGDAEIMWGAVIATFIDFIIISGIVYFVFKGLHLEKIDKEKNK